MNNKSDICVIKDELVSMLRAVGIQSIDTHEAYEIVDMIKDLAETEYYCKVTEAMEKADYGYEDAYEPMGYNRNRSATTGRYISGPGYRPMVDQEPYIREYLEHPNQRVNWNAMGYNNPSMTNGGSGYSGNGGGNSGGSSGGSGGSGYSNTGGNNQSGYGRSYENYRMARRHYTATKSEADKMEMNEHANKHLTETVSSLREIWDNADPEMKRRMKSDLQNLTAEMNA